MAKISDIAKKLNLSNATVSKALNGSKEISQATQKLVKDAAREMGYVPSSFARTLKMHRSFTIGVLFVDKTESGLRHEYFSSILNSVKVAAEAKGYDLTFINSGNFSGLTPSYLQHVKSRGIDGVVIASVDFFDPNVSELAYSGLPVVTIDHMFEGCSSIMSDNEDGTYELTKYAYQQGHRKIAFIHGEDTGVTHKRIAGYLRAIRELGMEPNEKYLLPARYHDPDSVRLAFKELVSLKEKPTCVLCPDDISALALLSSKNDAAYAKGISIAGYDGISLSRMIEPSLTTYCQDSDKIGRLAVEELISRIEEPKLFVPKTNKVKGFLQKGGTIQVSTGGTTSEK